MNCKQCNQSFIAPATGRPKQYCCEDCRYLARRKRAKEGAGKSAGNYAGNSARNSAGKSAGNSSQGAGKSAQPIDEWATLVLPQLPLYWGQMDFLSKQRYLAKVGIPYRPQSITLQQVD